VKKRHFLVSFKIFTLKMKKWWKHSKFFAFSVKKVWNIMDEFFHWKTWNVQRSTSVSLNISFNTSERLLFEVWVALHGNSRCSAGSVLIGRETDLASASEWRGCRGGHHAVGIYLHSGFHINIPEIRREVAEFLTRV
jgi:hypothetical protein